MTLHCVDEQPLTGVHGGPAISRAYVRSDGARYIAMCNDKEVVVTDFHRHAASQHPRTPGMSAASDCDNLVQKVAFD